MSLAISAGYLRKEIIEIYYGLESDLLDMRQMLMWQIIHKCDRIRNMNFRIKNAKGEFLGD
jgi:hypothetical protein